MAKITIEIETFQDYICTKCGEFTHSCFVKCLKCGNTNCIVEYKPRPKAVYVRKDSKPQAYNLLNSHDLAFQYYFYNLPDGMFSKRGFIIDAENDLGDIDDLTPLEIIKLIKEHYKKFIFSTDITIIENIWIWLDKNEKDQEILRTQDRIDLQKFKLWKAYRNLAFAEDVLEELKIENR